MMHVNGQPAGASLTKYLRQQGFKFTLPELLAAMRSAHKAGTSTIYLGKGQSFQLTGFEYLFGKGDKK